MSAPSLGCPRRASCRWRNLGQPGPQSDAASQSGRAPVRWRSIMQVPTGRNGLVLVPLSRRHVLTGIAVLGLWPLARARPAAAQPDGASTLATAATLTVLGGRVEHATGAGPASAARSGANLAEGDRVFTGPDGRALITFLDGSTVTVEPGSHVVVRQAASGNG